MSAAIKSPATCEMAAAATANEHFLQQVASMPVASPSADDKQYGSGVEENESSRQVVVHSNADLA